MSNGQNVIQHRMHALLSNACFQKPPCLQWLNVTHAFQKSFHSPGRKITWTITEQAPSYYNKLHEVRPALYIMWWNFPNAACCFSWKKALRECNLQKKADHFPHWLLPRPLHQCMTSLAIVPDPHFHCNHKSRSKIVALMSWTETSWRS